MCLECEQINWRKKELGSENVIDPKLPTLFWISNYYNNGTKERSQVNVVETERITATQTHRERKTQSEK